MVYKPTYNWGVPSCNVQQYFVELVQVTDLDFHFHDGVVSPKSFRLHRPVLNWGPRVLAVL